MQNAALYATSNAMQRRDAAVVLASHISAMTWEEEENILDVGCGSGDVTSSLLYYIMDLNQYPAFQPKRKEN